MLQERSSYNWMELTSDLEVWPQGVEGTSGVRLEESCLGAEVVIAEACVSGSHSGHYSLSSLVCVIRFTELYLLRSLFARHGLPQGRDFLRILK